MTHEGHFSYWNLKIHLYWAEGRREEEEKVEGEEKDYIGSNLTQVINSRQQINK